MSEKLITITTLAELRELQLKVEAANFVSYDTETTGVEKESYVIGLSVAMDCDTGYYVVLAYWDINKQELTWLETREGIVAFLQVLKTKRLVMQNGGFDCWMTANNFQVELIDSLHTDTMLAAHLLDENRRCGLKELGVAFFGEDADKESREMKESVHRNGGVLTKDLYELYKADWELIAKYGAKDALLTFKLFCVLVEQLFEQKLDKFFYDDETMPLLRTATYDMNTTGLAVDPVKLQQLRGTLEAECMEARAYVDAEVHQYVKDKYPGNSKSNHFNVNAPQQLSWLLFDNLGNEFNVLTKSGRALCKKLGLKIPYHAKAKREVIAELKARKGEVYEPEYFDKKKNKKVRAKKINDYWVYLSCGKESLTKYSKKYRWAEKFLEFKKSHKLLKTYVLGIQSRMKYNIIRPNFLQHGTTSGRYSCKAPNFQNLPRDDKRVKACIVARKGCVFVGADQAQLEPRVFASFSQDERLMRCFADGDDFYSVVGVDTFDKPGCLLQKDVVGSFSALYPDLRYWSKTFSLAAPYGTTAYKMAPTLGKEVNETQEMIDTYFKNFPGVHTLMLKAHETAKRDGQVVSLFGRPRRIPKAMQIPGLFGKSVKHADLPYEWRNILNLAVNHPIQSTGASIMNRSAIAIKTRIKELEASDLLWKQVHIVLQVHDDLVLEGPKPLERGMKTLLQDCMENTCILPGVKLSAIPKIAYNLADLK